MTKDNLTLQGMIQEAVNEIEAGKGEYDPETLAQKIVYLSALYTRLTVIIGDFEIAYARKLNEIQQTEPNEPFNKIEAIGKASEEFALLKKAQGVEKGLIQIIRAANRYVKLRENERETQRYHYGA